MMVRIPAHPALWDGITGITVVIAVASTIYSLTHGITDVFPFLYFLPIILFIYLHPNRGAIFSLLLSIVFLFLVCQFGYSDPKLVAIAIAWFVIFIMIGIVTSSFATGLRTEERKYQRIFENSQAGIFTFDCRTQRIREINEKCARMLKYERSDLAGRELSLILPDTYDRDIFVGKIKARSLTGEVELLFHTRDGTVRQFLVTATIIPSYTAICSAIDITERKLAEKVIQKAKDELEIRVRQRTEELMRANEALKADIQDRKRFEDAIQLANRKLNTLSNITRHDILNQITALNMYLCLAQEITTDAVMKEHLDRIDQITQLIQKQIRFTRDYQTIGTVAPQWQNVKQTIDNARTDIRQGRVMIDVGFDDVEIFADMLLERVFFNLIENSLRHGEKVTWIRFSCRRGENGLIISCEDDGAGIPAHAKEKIFRREYYRNTGYGLFLVTEILAITGITIQECGEPGVGARFEILVPPGSYRFSGRLKKD